jgi:hypothetical protein
LPTQSFLVSVLYHTGNWLLCFLCILFLTDIKALVIQSDGERFSKLSKKHSSTAVISDVVADSPFTEEMKSTK